MAAFEHPYAPHLAKVRRLGMQKSLGGKLLAGLYFGVSK